MSDSVRSVSQGPPESAWLPGDRLRDPHDDENRDPDSARPPVLSSQAAKSLRDAGGHQSRSEGAADRPPIPGQAVDRDDALSVLDLVGLLVRRRWLIAGISLAGTVLVFAYALVSLRLPAASAWNLLPDIYRPDAKVLLSEDDSSGLISLGMSGDQSGALGQLLGVSASSTSAALAQELLAGRTIHDQIVDEFGFIERYGFFEHPRTEARGLVASSLYYEFDTESAILTIAYEDTDPEFSAAVLARILELLEQRFRALTMETVLLQKQHVEERLAGVGADRQAAQDRLVAFHRATGIVDLEEQSAQSALLLAEYKRELLTKEVELQSLREFLPADDASVVQLQGQIDVVRQVLDELQSGFSSFSPPTIPRDELPAVAAEYLNLSRDLELQEQLYLVLRQQYELIRIDETDPSRTFQVVEAVEVPEVRYWPNRTLVSILGSLAAFLLSILLAFVMEYLARVQGDPVEAAKLAAIREQFVSRRRHAAGG